MGLRHPSCVGRLYSPFLSDPPEKLMQTRQKVRGEVTVAPGTSLLHPRGLFLWAYRISDCSLAAKAPSAWLTLPHPAVFRKRVSGPSTSLQTHPSNKPQSLVQTCTLAWTYRARAGVKDKVVCSMYARIEAGTENVPQSWGWAAGPLPAGDAIASAAGGGGGGSVCNWERLEFTSLGCLWLGLPVLGALGTVCYWGGRGMNLAYGEGLGVSFGQ